MTPARAHLFFRGRVQGVFFRAFTHEVANELGLSGWVKNLYDGRVEALFEGDRQKVEEAIQRCSEGPPGARVDDVDVRWEDYRGESRDFIIRH
jgi:acylphosphatase